MNHSDGWIKPHPAFNSRALPRLDVLHARSLPPMAIRGVVMVASLLLALSGCAFIAHRPRSPAQEVSYKDLNDPATDWAIAIS